jgi:Flp pilus assembly protein TadG
MSLSNMAATGSAVNRADLADGAMASLGASTHRIGFGGVGRLIGRMRRDRSGAAAVEMALATPVMLGLLMGTFEYGIAFFTYNTMQVAARDVGRQVAINTLPVGSAEGAFRGRLPDWARTGATVTIQQSAPANPNTNVYTFIISMPMNAATPVQFFSLANNHQLRTELRMKQELPYVTNP